MKYTASLIAVTALLIQGALTAPLAPGHATGDFTAAARAVVVPRQSPSDPQAISSDALASLAGGGIWKKSTAEVDKRQSPQDPQGISSAALASLAWKREAGVEKRQDDTVPLSDDVLNSLAGGGLWRKSIEVDKRQSPSEPQGISDAALGSLAGGGLWKKSAEVAKRQSPQDEQGISEAALASLLWRKSAEAN